MSEGGLTQQAHCSHSNAATAWQDCRRRTWLDETLLEQQSQHSLMSLDNLSIRHAGIQELGGDVFAKLVVKLRH